MKILAFFFMRLLQYYSVPIVVIIIAIGVVIIIIISSIDGDYVCPPDWGCLWRHLVDYCYPWIIWRVELRQYR